MPKPIRQLTLEQFRTLLRHTHLRRRIVDVHLHHTWRPTGAQFKGLETVEAMRRFHMENNGWSDIAQHLTIGADGSLWTGRPWDKPPASASGHNGGWSSGPFMIEMVGDFDLGRETLGGAQRRTAVEVVAALFARFELKERNLRFHNEFSAKTCPGSGVDQAELRREVAAAAAGAGDLKERSRTGGPFAARYLQGFGVTMPAPRNVEWQDEGELDESEAGPWAETDEPAEAASRGGKPGELPALDEKGLETLKLHAVNLSIGRLSEEGDFDTTDADLDRLFEHLGSWCDQRPAGETPRVLLWAHGGLVSENKALRTALRDLDFWLENGIYPIFLAWETAWYEILVQQTTGARGAVGDWLLERALKPVAKHLWSGIKESAELACRADLGDGESGGVYLVANRLRDFVNRRRDGGGEIEVHAAGHSAGSVLLSHLVEVLDSRRTKKLQLDSLAFLAPAVRVDLFLNKVADRIGKDKVVKRFTLFTMNKLREKRDSVAFLYRKSLLYFVSRACEPARKTPILGLQESVDGSPEVKALFRSAAADVLWAYTRDTDGPDACQADSHVIFDEDPATMDAIALRILDSQAPHPPVPHVGLRPGEGQRKKKRQLAAASRPASPAAVPAPAAAAPAAAYAAGRAGGAKRALCIGINDYPDAPLGGCVADAETWARELAGLGFEVSKLHDQEASRQAILDGIGDLMAGAVAGDVIVVQYAGHGSQVPDASGDESDAFDEALVPHDYRTGGLVLDDELADLYDRTPAGVNLSLFMDCCHSGTNSRFAPATRARGAGLKVRFMAAPAEVLEIHRVRGAASGPGRRSAVAHPETHFAACLDRQYAYEEGGQGWFTRNAAPHLAAAVAAGTSHSAFLDAVRGRFPGHLDQDPQMASGRPGGVLLAPLAGVSQGAPLGVTAPHALDGFLDDLSALIARHRQGRAGGAL